MGLHSSAGRALQLTNAEAMDSNPFGAPKIFFGGYCDSYIILFISFVFHTSHNFHSVKIHTVSPFAHALFYIEILNSFQPLTSFTLDFVM